MQTSLFQTDGQGASSLHPVVSGTELEPRPCSERAPVRSGVGGLLPYYEDAAVTIYHADSREVIPELPLQKFSLMATDPPYGMAFGGFRGVEQNVRADGARQGIRLVRSVVFEAMPHMKEDAHFYVFCHWESWPDFYDALTAYINVKSSLIWWKNRGGMGDTEMEYARDYEVILYGATGRRPLAGKRDGAVISGISPEGNIKTRCHPTQKPEGLMGYLIEKSCPPGEWVLDPFMGAGSTLVAAKQRGRRAVGIELNEAYCEAAAKRCASEFCMGGGGAEQVGDDAATKQSGSSSANAEVWNAGAKKTP